MFFMTIEGLVWTFNVFLDLPVSLVFFKKLDYVDSRIYAKIVLEKSWTAIYVLDKSLESLLKSLASPVVGLLSLHVPK
jgi:hypothetical protein